MGVVQTISLDELQRHLAAIEGIPRVVVGGNAATPWLVLDALDRSIERYRLHQLNSPVGIPVRSGVIAETSFVGPGMRHHPALQYVPSRLSMVPVLFQRTLPPDVVVLHCAPARDGMLSMGIEVNILPAAVDACRARGGLVIAVINSRMPYTFGDSQISTEAIDLAVEIDFELDSLQERTPDDDSIVIAERLAAMIDDGSTLQMGIGSVPDSTLRALASRRELGSGPSCSPTAYWTSTRPMLSMRITSLPRPSASVRASCMTGWTATRAFRCYARKRPTARR